jgi:hypothetical protein
MNGMIRVKDKINNRVVLGLMGGYFRGKKIVNLY